MNENAYYNLEYDLDKEFEIMGRHMELLIEKTLERVAELGACSIDFGSCRFRVSRPIRVPDCLDIYGGVFFVDTHIAPGKWTSLHDGYSYAAVGRPFLLRTNREHFAQKVVPHRVIVNGKEEFARKGPEVSDLSPACTGQEEKPQETKAGGLN